MDANSIRQIVPVKAGDIIEAHTIDGQLGTVGLISRPHLLEWEYALGDIHVTGRFLDSCITRGQACLLVVHEDGACLREIEPDDLCDLDTFYPEQGDRAH